MTTVPRVPTVSVSYRVKEVIVISIYIGSNIAWRDRVYIYIYIYIDIYIYIYIYIYIHIVNK